MAALRLGLVRAWLSAASLLLGLTIASEAPASSSVLVRVTDASGNLVPSITGTDSGSGGYISTATVQIANLPTESVGNSTSFAVATEGMLGVGTMTNATGQRSKGTIFQASAKASFTDHLSFTGGPSSFILEADILLSGVMFSSAQATSPTSLTFGSSSVNLLGTGIGSSTGTLRVDDLNKNNIDVAIPTRFHLKAQVSPGAGLDLSFILTATSQSTAPSTSVLGDTTNATSGADYEHTLRWGGITQFSDSAGHPLSGIAVSSASGFDYMTSAVPEPPLYALLGMGIFAVASFSRRANGFAFC
jgi:hypothetical protein